MLHMLPTLIICAFLSATGFCLQSGDWHSTADHKVTRRPARRCAVTRGDWSAAAVWLFNTWTAFADKPGRRIVFTSPDRKKQIEVSGWVADLRVGGRSFKTGINSITGHDSELAWAPDSSKYFVTWSESGELGPWHMQVFGVDGSGVHEFGKVEEPAREDFERRARARPIDPELNNPEGKHFGEMAEYCEPYHVIGARWLNGSKEILLSVLIRNTGHCRDMSDFNVYGVDAITGQILQRYSAVEAHRLFGHKYLPLITH